MDDKIKTFKKKIKTENEKKKKNFDKIKELEIELVKFKYSNNPSKLQSELKELKKIQVVNKNLHEIKQEKVVYYAGEFEMVGSLKVGDKI